VTWGNSIKALFWIVSIGALLFLAAGTLDWPGAWIFMAEFVVGGIAVTLWLAWRDPGLLKERMAGPFQKGQVFWDKVFIGFIIVVWFSWLVLMALDAKRWELSHMPDALKVVGVAAPVIKIQKERGQHVISTGPYAIVRHPMYAGGALYMIGMPLLLGSGLGLLVLRCSLALSPCASSSRRLPCAKAFPATANIPGVFVIGLSQACGEICSANGTLSYIPPAPTNVGFRGQSRHDANGVVIWVMTQSGLPGA